MVYSYRVHDRSRSVFLEVYFESGVSSWGRDHGVRLPCRWREVPTRVVVCLSDGLARRGLACNWSLGRLSTHEAEAPWMQARRASCRHLHYLPAYSNSKRVFEDDFTGFLNIKIKSEFYYVVVAT